MASITPSRSVISDRFPVASFIVQVPAERCFEIACATDPRLFAAESQSSRRPENFFSTRLGGLMRAPAGEATVLIPPQQLSRFAGARRLYYVLGTYQDAYGRGSEFTALPEQVDALPYIQLSPDFTGRGLATGRAQERWGAGGQAALIWGGDQRARRPAQVDAYDDGYDPALWSRGEPAPRVGAPAPQAFTEAPAPDTFDVDDLPEPGGYDPDGYGRRSRAARSAPTEPEGHEDGRGLASSPAWGRRAPAEPEGVEDGRSLGAGPTWGRRGPVRRAEPEGFEDANAAFAAGYGRRGPAAAAVAEPEGLEDGRGAPAYGQGAAPVVAPRPADPDAYGRREAAGVAFDTRERVRVLAPVLQARGGAEAYAVAAAEPGRGLRWGFAGFAQDDGGLAEVLCAAFGREGSHGYQPLALAERAIGADPARQLRAWAEAAHREPARRSDAAGGQALSDPAWVDRLRRLGGLHQAAPQGLGLSAGEDPFKAAQNEVAIRRIFGELLPAARRLGARTDRALAILLDQALDFGVPAAERWYASTVGGAEPAQRLGGNGHPRLARLAADRTQLHDTIYDLGEG